LRFQMEKDETPRGGDRITILLQRVCDLTMPPNDDPNSPNYNPYITVDYMRDVPAPKHTPQSVGRKSPYVAQTEGGQGNAFKRDNDDLSLPFPWLAHLDRKLISPTEIMQVTTAKPADLTHTFMNSDEAARKGVAVEKAHLAPWLTEKSRL